MREFGWTERELLEEVTIEKVQQIAYVYEVEHKKEKLSKSGMPHISDRQIKKMR